MPLRTRVRALIAATTTALAVAALAGGSLGTAVAAGDPQQQGEQGQTSGAGGALIEVPYQGGIDASPNASWRIADCDAVRGAFSDALDGVNDEVLRLEDCAPDGLSVRSDLYDPEQPALSVPVELSDGTVTAVLHYRVVLAPPEPPSFNAKTINYDFPLAAGSRALLPISELGLACGTCGGGVQLRIGSVSPEGARATASSTHLIVTPSGNAPQTVTVELSAADDTGQWSQPMALSLRFSAPAAEPVVAANVISAIDGQHRIDLAELVTGADDWSVIACGDAMHGRVVCGRDGTIDYIPDRGATADAGDRVLDQFSYHLATPDGAQDSGSVTLVAAGGGLERRPVSSVGTSDGDGVTKTLVVPAAPVPDEQTTTSSRFDAFIGVLNGDSPSTGRTSR